MPYKDRGQWRGVVKAAGKRISKAFPTKAEAKRWEADARATRPTPCAGLGLYEVAARYLEHAEREVTAAVFRAKKRRGLFRGKSTTESTTDVTPFDTPPPVPPAVPG